MHYRFRLEIYGKLTKYDFFQKKLIFPIAFPGKDEYNKQDEHYIKENPLI